MERVIDAAEDACERLRIPADMISLHGDLRHAVVPEGMNLQGTRQHRLRWGAFLLAYAPLEGFFNSILKTPLDQRVVPLNSDKIRDRAANVHNVKLFTNHWAVRTLVPPEHEDDNYCTWRTYRGSQEIRIYLADMKSLRDRLSHGADPLTTTNESGALWITRRGPSLRMMGVDGFLQASYDLVNQTISTFGGTTERFPDWPVSRDSEFVPPMPGLERLELKSS